MTQEAELPERITVRPEIFGGKPIIRDMRIAVEHVLGKLAAGDTAEMVLHEYPISRLRRHSSMPDLRQSFDNW